MASTTRLQPFECCLNGGITTGRPPESGIEARRGGYGVYNTVLTRQAVSI